MAPVEFATKSEAKPRPHVLIVDDEPALLELMDDVVGRQVQCEMFAARNLAEARRIMAEQAIELLVTDLNLPDGNGMSLLSELKTRQPNASALVITGCPSVDGAIDAMRQGAVDFVPKPFTANQLTERVQKALSQQSIIAKNDRRIARLQSTVKRLSHARRVISKKVDLLCNDLITAYGDLSRQLDWVRIQESFRNYLGDSNDLEQVLCHAMDWVLRQMGYSNIALWLTTDEQNYQLGAYLKYNIPGDEPMIDALQRGLVQRVAREGLLHLSSEEAEEYLTPVERDYLSGQSILAVNCTYLGESLAALVLFRGEDTPFKEEDAEVLRSISAIFAATLSTAVHKSRPSAADPDSNFDNDNPDRDTPRSDADWWKRGEAPPF